MKKRIFLVIVLLLFLSALLTAWELAGPSTAFRQDKYYLYVKTGMNFEQVNALLIKDTVLNSPVIFRWVAKKMDYPANVKAGRYEIKNGASLISILRMLIKGRQSPVNLTITKLRTKEDLSSLVGRKLECDSASFMRFLENNDSLKIYHLDTNLVMTEILPNTYNYYWNTTPARVFRKLLDESKRFWTPARVQLANERGLTPATAYIVASIVEEETNKKDDKGKMASVYLNRISKGMRLAADPTVKFALRNFELKRIYDKYLTVESPYNTYKYAGLPPGPICTPSIETLEAVLASPKTNYLYFVAKPDFSGYSNFAETFEQHMQYARAYQKALDEQMRIGQAESSGSAK